MLDHHNSFLVNHNQAVLKIFTAHINRVITATFCLHLPFAIYAGFGAEIREGSGTQIICSNCKNKS